MKKLIALVLSALFAYLAPSFALSETGIRSCPNCMAEVEASYNADTHTLACSSCDYAETEQAHNWGYINASGQSREYGCTICAFANTCQDRPHTWTSHYIDDEFCGVQCTVCNYLTDIEVHRVTCAAPSLCISCEHEVTPRTPRHTYSLEYQYNDACHWRRCDDCESIIKASHTAYCNASDTCWTCGYTGEIAIVSHMEYTMDLGDGTHRISCSWCDYESVETH
ncbi:MAG: hypothetical protein IKK21_05120 [Clostridia bacterium]|nr:hypothetical protein [Clostridia bacterium]